MNARRTTLPAAAAGLLLLLAACGDPGSGGGTAETSASSSGGTVCEPVAGDQLVVLEDDKGLQNADNVIPAVNAAAAQADPGLVPLLDTVSAALDTDKLIQLNKAVDIDRRTSSEAAQQFVEDEGLAASDATAGSGKSVIIGAANFSESATLSEIYADVLRSAGYTAEVQTIGNRETYLPALQSGQITLTPEYAATLAEFLNTSANGADAEPVASGDPDETVAALTELGTAAGLTFGAVSEAQDQNAFAVTSEFADEHGVTTLSDLAEACSGGVVLAGPAECPERPFCQIGLEDTYGITVSEFTSYDFGLIGDAVRQGEASIGLVLSSDGSLAS
ncbi:glycine/betaine ABC transporter substrate-binding protein [Cellulomonas sp. ACRRI]|uniref:glycine betaine ABC transporter substrate-binding protein n=1 Tax=Cellulomonas sp. ACRRI TaxID=2918188 RepID=UPI001EF29A57|nr:glycine betaine ABC transporter substrate-binding protein [Cellulomonas sp. ACRRI]MCG7287672.1 glycine/betaine ABC transporter substrate-binding protein [Cellulomonas sp. ACRRI]